MGKSLFQWHLFLAALGLAFVLEGLLYFLAPEAVRRLASRIPSLSPGTLRLLGFLGIAAGLGLVGLSRLAR